MSELCELGRQYRTDKTPYHIHSYTPKYYELFKDRRNEVKKVLEVGIGIGFPIDPKAFYISGGSLRMWRDFFPNATIYGADIDERSLFTEERIKTFLCDQTDVWQLKVLMEKIWNEKDSELFDLIVDDGSHVPDNQIRTAKALAPFLSDNGIYVIEDVISAHIEHVFNNVKEGYDCEKLMFKEKPELPDNNLILIRKICGRSLQGERDLSEVY